MRGKKERRMKPQMNGRQRKAEGQGDKAKGKRSKAKGKKKAGE
jgi:hypothetical protein